MPPDNIWSGSAFRNIGPTAFFGVYIGSTAIFFVCEEGGRTYVWKVGADHDYQGHRIRAMEHVSAALRHLGAPFDLNTSFGPGAGNRSQAQSDQILRDAISQLRNVESSLGRATSTDAHHHTARSSVKAAIRELRIALNIR